MKLSINTISLEGPDLSGKSSLFSEVHKVTDFKWNIQDRSFLSMLCYAKLYGRSEEEHRRRLKEDLSNLNNRYVILIPEWKEIERRFHTRGDEIQDLKSLRKLYEIFLEEAHKIRSLPNVLIPNLSGSVSLETLASQVTKLLNESEAQTPSSMANYVKNRVAMSGECEISPLNFQLFFEDEEDLFDDDIMLYPPETEYYTTIKNKTIKKIQQELSGDNEYGVVQDAATSRRFIFTGDSCISYIHTLWRGGPMNVNVVCRSSDVGETFKYDLRFLTHLSALIREELHLCVPINLRITLNSAHVVNF